jgi:hypothetical protein
MDGCIITIDNLRRLPIQTIGKFSDGCNVKISMLPT